MDAGLRAERGWHRGPKTRALLDRDDVQRDLDLAQALGTGSLAAFDALGDERDLWIGRHERQQTTCRDCGRQITECADHKRTFYPFRRVCYATMEREAAEAAYAALHDEAPYHDGTFTSWRKERSRSHPYRFDSGVMIGVADHDLTPWDQFTTREDASPIPPQGDEAVPEVGESAEGD